MSEPKALTKEDIKLVEQYATAHKTYAIDLDGDLVERLLATIEARDAEIARLKARLRKVEAEGYNSLCSIEEQVKRLGENIAEVLATQPAEEEK